MKLTTAAKVAALAGGPVEWVAELTAVTMAVASSEVASSE